MSHSPFRLLLAGASAALASSLAAPAMAQTDEDAAYGVGAEDIAPPGPARPDSVYDDNWIAIGAGVRLDTSYDGSDDYVVRVLPALAGSFKGVRFTPRAAGLALGVFEADLSDDVEINGGPVFRVRTNRANGIKDPVVKAAGELGTAIEVGGTLGITFKRVLSKYDRISIGSDVRFDVNGAHGGYVLDPGISYRTPLSQGLITGVSVGAQYGGGGFNDYYYSVNPQQSADSGLPQFTASEGFYKAGGSLFLGIDLDGDFQNGGFAIGILAGYSRMLGDAKQSPYTSIRGSADQFSAAAGVGFIF